MGKNRMSRREARARKITKTTNIILAERENTDIIQGGRNVTWNE